MIARIEPPILVEQVEFELRWRVGRVRAASLAREWYLSRGHVLVQLLQEAGVPTDSLARGILKRAGL